MIDLKSFITKGVLTAMAVVSVGTASLGIAKANNYADSEYNFSFDYNGDWTEVRAKEDQSASYMKCISSDDDNCIYYACVFGCDDYSRSGAERCSYEYSYSAGTTRYHSNWVNPKHDYAYFYGYSDNAVGFYGVWSPDNYQGIR